jgi:hypothetical protein
MFNNFYVFGDSHARCFSNIVNNLYFYPAASAKGLSNSNSISKTNQSIISILNALPEKTNIIFFFGKVDLDFILNYKYNLNIEIDFNKYILDIVNSYIDFIKINTIDKNVFLCELPITHINDNSLKQIIAMEDIYI